MHGRVLSIAGSDSGGGAGIQADIKAIMAMDGFAVTAITAITAQNTVGVHEVLLLPVSLVRRQIQAVLDDIGADAVKIGMLGSAAMAAAVAAEITARAPAIPLVLDPVMVAKGGAALLDDDAISALRHLLLPMATLVTPNIPEAEALLGRPITDGAQAAADLRRFAPAVLLKGGHAEGETVVDFLAHEGGVERIERPRLYSRHTHGTGCTLASAIAAGLAQGRGLADAVSRARSYVQDAIRTAPGYGAGHGPLNHNAWLGQPG